MTCNYLLWVAVKSLLADAGHFVAVPLQAAQLVTRATLC